MVKTKLISHVVLLTAGFVVVLGPPASADPDPHACQVLQAASPQFQKFDDQRVSLQKQLAALHAARTAPDSFSKWQGLQRQLGELFRDTQNHLGQTADQVDNTKVEQALRDEASIYSSLADSEDEMLSYSDAASLPADVLDRFNGEAAQIGPAADQINTALREACGA